MNKWFRKTSIDGFGAGQDTEHWELTNAQGKTLRSYPVHVETGKHADIFSFKPAKAVDYIASVKKMRTMREKFFAKPKPHMANCPICRESTKKSKWQVTIYGGKYHQCDTCGHCYIINRPSKEEVEDFYAHSTTYHTTYTNKRILKERIKQIAIPKVKWVVEQYKRKYGREPRSILDIGAGAGHFVYACRQLGIKSQGIEVSDASRGFCKDIFGFELDNCDVSKDWARYRDFDIVTFWGVIEHVTSPIELLSSAYRILKGRQGLVVCEVPHWNCMSTVLQKASPHIVVRHLDPMGHINVFTENSLISTYEQSGFKPVSAWYYGMDFYESISHLMYRLKDDCAVKLLSGMMNEAQYIFDRGRLSDTIILAAAPLPKPIK